MGAGGVRKGDWPRQRPLWEEKESEWLVSALTGLHSSTSSLALHPAGWTSGQGSLSKALETGCLRNSPFPP